MTGLDYRGGCGAIAFVGAVLSAVGAIQMALGSGGALVAYGGFALFACGFVALNFLPAPDEWEVGE